MKSRNRKLLGIFLIAIALAPVCIHMGWEGTKILIITATLITVALCGIMLVITSDNDWVNKDDSG